MPYFIYRVSGYAAAEMLVTCDHFDEAIAVEKALRDPAGLPHDPGIRMIEANTEGHARELLFHTRSPQEGLIGES
jgi:hypothetical protein